MVFIRAPLHHGGANVSCLCCYYYYICTLQILFSIRRNYLAEFHKEQLAENFKVLKNNSPDRNILLPRKVSIKDEKQSKEARGYVLMKLSHDTRPIQL